MHAVSEVRVKRLRSSAFSSTDTFRHLADWRAISDTPLSLGSTVHELERVGYVSSTVTNGMVLNFELVGVTEHNFDQKYTTSWVMEDLFSQNFHA